MRAQSLQSCPTLCDPMDCSPPGSSVNGILQARNTGVSCHTLLQRIFPTQGSNLLCLLQLLHRRRILYLWATQEALYLIVRRQRWSDELCQWPDQGTSLQDDQAGNLAIMRIPFFPFIWSILAERNPSTSWFGSIRLASSILRT